MAILKFKQVGVAALVAAGFVGVASANVVDLFTDPPGGQGVSVNSAAADGTTAFSQSSIGGSGYSSILGGYRDIELKIVTNSGNSFDNSTASVNNGSFGLSTPANVNAIATVQWDGDDNSATLDVDGLGGLSMINQVGCPVGGCDKFVSSVSFADLQFQYSISVWDMSGNYSTLTSGAPGGITTTTPIDFPFAWWNLGAGAHLEDGVPFFITTNGVVNFNNVGALEFVINDGGGTVSVDLALGAITKTGVPEPASIALVGLALLGIGAARRRKG